MSPNPDIYYPAASQKSMWYTVDQAIKAGEGTIVLCGEPGTGKTLFLLRLQEILSDKRDMIILSNPQTSYTKFLNTLVETLDKEVALKMTDSLEEPSLKHLYEALEKCVASGKKILVAVDESQALNTEILDTLSLSVQFSVGGAKVVQVLLTGRSELLELMTEPHFTNLAGMIIASGTFSALPNNEIRGYINYMLRASYRSSVSMNMQSSAWREIYKLSKGVPRQINRIMRRLLIVIDEGKPGRITARYVQEAVEYMNII